MRKELEPAGGKRQGQGYKRGNQEGMCQVISSDTMKLQPGCYGNQMDLQRALFYISHLLNSERFPRV